MTTASQLRRAALALPEVEESESGSGSGPSFHVGGTEFASLSADSGSVQLRLSDDDVSALLAENPGATPLTRGASVLGATLSLADIDGQQLNRWVRQAWKHRAPTRLVAEAERAERAEPGGGGLPRSIGRPATRALAEAGIVTLDDVSRLSDAELAALHGVGPKAFRILRDAISAAERD